LTPIRRQTRVFRSYVTASGEIVATRFADIGSSVMGRLVHLSVAEGDRVKTGQWWRESTRAGAERGRRGVRGRSRAAGRGAGRAPAGARDPAEVEQARAVAREAAARLQREQLLRRDGLTTAAAFDAAEPDRSRRLPAWPRRKRRCSGPSRGSAPRPSACFRPRPRRFAPGTSSRRPRSPLRLTAS